MKELFEALANAQSELPPIHKTKRVSFQSNRGKIEYSYADGADINKTVTPIFTKHGLAIIQLVDMREQQVMVQTIITHKSGDQYQTGTLSYPIAGDIKQVASLITYLRRYSLCAALNIFADEDLDAEGVPETAEDLNEVHHRIVALGNVTNDEDLRADTKFLINKYPYAKERIIAAATKIHNERFATPNNDGVINEPAAE